MRRARWSVAAALAIPLGLAAVGRAQDADAPPPARIGGVVELAGEVLDRPVESALGWMKFVAAGYREPAEHLGNGEAADAELALGDAVEKSVKAFLETLPGKKSKVRLNELLEGTVVRIEEGGIVLQVNKAEALVPWPEIDPARLAIQMVKSKPTAEAEIAAVAMLRLLCGDPVDARRQAGKLAGELGRKLQELVDDWKSVGPELAAARSLDAALRERDATKAVELLRSGWTSIRTTRLGGEVAAKTREQFVLRGEQAFAGDVALKATVHGRITTTPSRAHPAAGPGGVGLEIEYDFEKDAEGPDFDPGAMSPALRGVLRSASGGRDVRPVPFVVHQSRLVGGEPCGGELPIEFGGDVEIEVQGGLTEMPRQPFGFLGVGLTTRSGDQMILLQNYAALDVVEAGKKGGPSMEKKIEGLRAGAAHGVTLRLAGGKLTFTRDGQKFEPALNVAPLGMLRPFVIAGSGCQWFVQRLVVRGTATRESLELLARRVAEKEADALFGR